MLNLLSHNRLTRRSSQHIFQKYCIVPSSNLETSLPAFSVKALPEICIFDSTDGFATFQAKEVAFGFQHTPDAHLPPCFYMTRPECG